MPLKGVSWVLDWGDGKNTVVLILEIKSREICDPEKDVVPKTGKEPFWKASFLKFSNKGAQNYKEDKF